MENVTLTTEVPSRKNISAAVADLLALVVVWSFDEPQRVGEIALIPSDPPGEVWILGRGEAHPPTGRLKFYRQRPGRLEPTGSLQGRRISREQLHIRTTTSGTLDITNVGRCPLRVGGKDYDHIEMRPGDLMELRQEVLLYCVRRPSLLVPMPEDLHYPAHHFGEADAFGVVGESPSTWEFRRQLAFIAPRQTHVLVLGASGTGKELAAKAIHTLSPRRRKVMVSRNAATFPEGILDAELFGNMKNYPNPGMPERPGLIGEADNSTLFLDEIGELPSSLQAHLLRVLDQGEYQRLGESTVRHSNLRLVAATNRPESALKHDVLARLRARIVLQELNTRREDIPLIARHVMRRIAKDDAGICQRFMAGGNAGGEPRFSGGLMASLMQHHYTTNVRELENLLWQSMGASKGDSLELVDGMRIEIQKVADPRPRIDVDPAKIPAEVIQASLDKHNGVQDRVWRELGLPSRFVLYRLIKKHNLVVRRDGQEVDPDPVDGEEPR